MSHPTNSVILEQLQEEALELTRFELIAELGFSSPETGIGVSFIELVNAVANKRFYEAGEPC